MIESRCIEIEKPYDWPQNAREAALSNIIDAVDRFKCNPSFRTKEVLVSLVTDYDLNQRSSLGFHRVTEYEVSLINSLYFEGLLIQCNALRAYLYEHVGTTALLHKQISMIEPYEGKSSSSEIEVYTNGLLPQLKLYYLSYLKYLSEGRDSFVHHLVGLVDEIIGEIKENGSDYLDDLSHGYLSLLNDISYFRCTRRTKIWAFSRNDIKEIFSLEAKMIKRLNQDPCARPLKGVLMTSISNYILKSRNDYNSDYIVKYIPSKDAMSAAANNQIWIREISCLNDDREGALLSEIMSSTDWNSYEWASSVDLKPKRKYYISSFSKSYVDDKMLERYGDCIYGFKDDRLADLLAPIYIQHFENKETGEKKDIPAFSQVVCYDVIYDIEESKKEISYLCDLIDCFDIPDASKHSFLEEILQYWIYSVKDANKWKQERERRYIPFLYDDYEYIELDLTDPVYAKLKTSIFLLPDFIMGNTPCKGHIEKYIENKMNVLSTKKFCYCMNCLSRDYDSVLDYNVDGERKCSVCGSKSVKLVTPSHV